MQKIVLRASVALMLMIGTVGGIGAQVPGKTANKTPNKTPSKPAEKSASKPAEKSAKKADGAAGKTSKTPAVPPPAVGTPKTPTKPATAVATPASTTIKTGAASSKIDPAIQKRIAAAGAKLKPQEGQGGVGVVEKNDLKQIGLALHNYESVHNHFPAANGSGTKDQPHPGLSWRVYLLPFLEEAPLFEQFKLDEAWDSENNKPLIAKMPQVFGKNAEGKTRVHVLTGKGLAFNNDVGTRIADITDGTSNSILAIQGGADTADFWTKPGGLAFDPKDPLKCLGKTSDSFLSLLADGSVVKLSKAIVPKTFSGIALISDGSVVGDFTAVPGTENASTQVTKVRDPVTPLKPASSRLDLSYIPKDAFAAVVLHPRRIYEHPVVKNVRQVIPAGASDPETLGLPYGAREGLGELNGLTNLLGIAPQNVDEVIVLFDKDLIQAAMAGPEAGMPPLGGIIRNSAPLEVDQVVKTLTTKLGESCEVQEYQGVSLIVSMPAKVSFAMINDSTILVGQADFVKKMIAARDQATGTTPLTKRLEAAGNRLTVLAIDGVAVQATVKQLSQQLPGPVALFAPYIVGAKELGFTFDLDAPELFQVNLQFKNAQLAGGLFAMLEQQYNQAKEQAPMLREMMSAEATSKSFVPYFDQLLSGTKLANATDTISFTVPKLKDLEKLPELLKPSIELANQAAERAIHRNNLKQIGLAFHNFHDVYQTFPALNGNGVKDQPQPGLGWRVYLLPFIDQSSLYQEFKLDEPWDSAHNKALIAKMPKVYGTNKEGKSSIHVFTGKGAPFKNDIGTRIADITDGTSNTLLVVEAGDDVAEIWTKPGGLEFDVENPLKCLGKIKEFHALMMDGSVRYLKNIAPEMFGRLVQHQDGMVVELE